MKKKLVTILALAALVLAGASAQFMFGLSGAVLTDQKITQDFVQQVFDNGDAWYGGFMELGFGKTAVGVSVNFSSPYAGFSGDVENDAASLYLDYHLFGTRALLDLFFEGGLGVIGSRYADQSVQDDYGAGEDWLTASYFWNAGIGLGANLGLVGVFGKLTYNYAISSPVQMQNGGDFLPYDPLGTGEAYVPAFGFTLGAKLIL